MSIKYAILGILSYQAYSGYDIKKVMQDSSFMHWSGNNNQIYKALLELLEEGYVTSETKHQDSLPSKKIYSITEDGLVELKKWVCSEPDLPDIKKTFLVQLAWADQLNKDELKLLLFQYENELRNQITLRKANRERGYFFPARSKREEALWNLIFDNALDTYESELNWINKVREVIDLEASDTVTTAHTEDDNEQGTDEFHYDVSIKDDKRFIIITSKIKEEQNVLDMVASCMDEKTNLVIITDQLLPEEFFDLKSGMAAGMLQKITNYHVRVAIVLTQQMRKPKDLKLLKSIENTNVKIFNYQEEAGQWLIHFS
ncbi:MAG: hypothetical protein K0S47_2799 [Herbinix sp.]|nr:hypothetical protein [Herbinix sp.]